MGAAGALTASPLGPQFCLLVCSLCAALALLGRHLPGAVASYLLGEPRPPERRDPRQRCLLSAVLALFLWPLVSSQDVAPWLRPALRKLDFGVGELLQKIKENHGSAGGREASFTSALLFIGVASVSERRLSQAQREQENLESDLSSMCPQVSKGHPLTHSPTQFNLIFG